LVLEQANRNVTGHHPMRGFDAQARGPHQRAGRQVCRLLRAGELPDTQRSCHMPSVPVTAADLAHLAHVTATVLGFAHPPFIAQIPPHYRPWTRFKGFFRNPPQLLLDLPRIHRVPPIMPQPILHVCDQLPAGVMARTGQPLVQQTADGGDQLRIDALVIAPR
jgi:hypothetical protein